MQENTNEKELLELGEQMIRLRFAMDTSHLAAVFREISISDYLILSNLARRMRIHEPEIKVYLSEISKELELQMNQVSRIVQNLQNKGYVYWQHDSRGTYIYLSETGRAVMRRQQDTLRTFFQNIIARMGREEFTKCVEQMSLLEDMVEAEAERFSNSLKEEEDKPETDKEE